MLRQTKAFERQFGPQSCRVACGRDGTNCVEHAAKYLLSDDFSRVDFSSRTTTRGQVVRELKTVLFTR